MERYVVRKDVEEYLETEDGFDSQEVWGVYDTVNKDWVVEPELEYAVAVQKKDQLNSGAQQ